MTNLIPKLLQLILITSFSSSSMSTEKSERSLFDMSLRELLNTQVVVASKKSEAITSAPSVVTIVDIASLKLMGISRLADALSMVPGVQIQKSHPGGTQVMIRGLSETFNQKVLFLLNGAPYWMSTHADIPLLALPLELIERVEVIRGPGSVIYGTNASAGVINVVLKKNANEREINLSLGSFQTNRVSAYQSQRTNWGYYFFGASSQKQNEGSEVYWEQTLLNPGRGDQVYYQAGLNSDGTPNFQKFPDSGSQFQKEEYKNLTGGFKYNQISATLNFFHSETSGLGGLPVIFEDTLYEQEGYLLDLNYADKMNSLSWDFYFRHNVMFLEFTTSNFLPVGSVAVETNTRDETLADGSPIRVLNTFTGKQQYSSPYQNNYRTSLGANFEWQLNDSLNFLSGIEYELRSAGDYSRTDIDDNFDFLQARAIQADELSIYGQFDWDIKDWRLVFGGRRTDNELAGTNFAPRAGIVYSLSDNMSLKALYSVGFNSPTLSQTELNINDFIFGNKDLQAEEVETLDFAFSWVEKSQIISANIYYTETDNLIARVFDAGRIQYQNVPGFIRRGFEFDYQRSFDTFTLKTNFAFNKEGNQTIDNDPGAELVPKYALNLAALYHFDEQNTVGFALRHWGERGGDQLTIIKDDPRFQVPSQSIFNFNYHHQWENLGLSFRIENLFDENIKTPDHSSGLVPSIPWGPGRGFFLEIKWQN